MIAIVKFKKRITNTCIFCINIYKFRHRQKLCPVILLLIDKKPWTGFHSAILLLSPAIYLRIKGYRQLLLDTKKVI